MGSGRIVSPTKRAVQRTMLADVYHKSAELHLQGKTLKEIGEITGRCKATVCRDLKAIRAEWRKQAVQDIGEKIADELAKVNNVERQAWEAWEKSKRNKEVRTTKSIKGTIEKTIQTEGQSGNPTFLGKIIDCIQRRCELLGLDRPKKKVVSGPDGGPVQLQAVLPNELPGFTDERLEQIIVECSARIKNQAAIETSSTPVYDVHPAGLPGELASQHASGDAGQSEQGRVKASNDLLSASERQERVD